MPPKPHLDHPIDAQGTGRGDGTLQLDGTARAGGGLSGVVSAPARIAGSDVQVHVECVRTSPSLSSGPFRTIMWRGFVVLDGTRLAQNARGVSVPFAFQLPDTAMPTDRAERLRVDWLLRGEAPGWTQEFGVDVAPGDGSQPATSLREVPEIAPAELAARLGVKVESVAGGLGFRPGFPRTSFTLMSALLLAAIALPLSGLSWGAQAAVAAGGLALAMALVVMLTTTRVVAGAGRVRLERGLLGIGFHTTVAEADVTAVEETGTDDRTAERFYGVNLRMKDGRRHSAVIRERDAARARALAWAMESALGGRVGREIAERAGTPTR